MICLYRCFFSLVHIARESASEIAMLSLLPFYVTFADYYILSPTKKKPDKETQVKPNEPPPKPDGLNTGPDENVRDVCERYV